jgi:3-phosphoshikimate 1-carboxyvinyltransferase
LTDLIVEPQKTPLRGIVPVASDKSIVHRAILLGALAEGASRIEGAMIGDDHRSTIGALRACGVAVEIDEQAHRIVVHGNGLERLSEPPIPLDCGNSGTTMRLLAGILAAQRFKSVLVGDPSLSGRPMARIANPLRQRGARIEGKQHPKKVGEITAPLEIGPLPAPNVLAQIAYDSPVASAQVKGALLLSGLYSDGKTIVSEPVVSRDHTERMLDALGVPIRRVGSVVELDGAAWSGKLAAFELGAIGDPSAAAFALAAALVVPGSDVGVRSVGINPTRMGFVDLVRLMGGEIIVEPKGETLGEPFGDVRARSTSLQGLPIGGEVIARAIDEVPILAVLAARSHGTTTLRDAAELRVKESDRIAATVKTLRAFGVSAEELPDGFVVEGTDQPLKGADVESGGDHRIAMSAAVLALAASSPTRVRDVDCIRTSFPRFVGTMRALGVQISVA